jgi:hypothetical protein
MEGKSQGAQQRPARSGVGRHGQAVGGPVERLRPAALPGRGQPHGGVELHVDVAHRRVDRRPATGHVAHQDGHQRGDGAEQGQPRPCEPWARPEGVQAEPDRDGDQHQRQDAGDRQQRHAGEHDELGEALARPLAGRLAGRCGGRRGRHLRPPRRGQPRW